MDDDRDRVDTALVPARIINEHVYCPRLAWFEWEANVFVESGDTAEGSDAHRRVDEERGKLGEAEDEGGERVTTSLTLGSEAVGVISKLDKVEIDGDTAIPVETKHGEPREEEAALWDPELAQVVAQSLLLREHGYRVPHVEVFFSGSRERRTVELPDDAEEWVAGLVDEVRGNVASSEPPPPLVDSPKCPRCSLVSICLPDEVNLLKDRAETRPRRLVAPDDPATPLYVSTPGAFVRKRSGRLVLEEDGAEAASRRLIDISHVAVLGNATVGSAAMRACLQGDIPILWLSWGGWLSGYSIPHGGSWVARRQRQYAAAESHEAVQLARAFVAGKIRNQRTLLRRLSSGRVDGPLEQLADLAGQADEGESVPSLYGLEGTAARLYFQEFSTMLSERGGTFELENRNRRPPRDPVNALLSFSYALLLKDVTVSAVAAGLDPQVGYLHQSRFGRPSLALDLAEEFRPLVADSAVVTAINNGEMRDSHFVDRGGSVGLTKKGRNAFIKSYERRMAVEIRHPIFGYKTSYRRAMELQARQLAARIEGELDTYRSLTTR